MKKLSALILLISLSYINVLFAQISFTAQDFGFRGSSYGAVEFGDYDADGDLDLLVLGEEDIGSRVGLIYINTGNTFNPDSVINLPYEFVSGDAKWGDYDADGDLDILVSGQTSGRLTAVLRNDAGVFNEQDFNLINVDDSAVDWADYDNDGDLDAAITGFDFNFDRSLILYKNTNDTLNVDLTMAGVRVGDLEFVDYDTDGDMDLFLTGSADDGRFSALLKNNSGSFTDSEIPFVPMMDAASDFGDYDGDGDLDLLLSGNGNDGSLEARTIIYRNDLAGFTRLSFEINHLERSDVKWADFDNDGDLDFVQSGQMISGDYVTEVYENISSGFIRIEQTFPDSVRNSAISVGDYDRDGDMDFALAGWNSDGDRFTVIYSNNAFAKNTIPGSPQMTQVTISEDKSQVELYWGEGFDIETQLSGLTYNLKIGTAPGATDIMSAHVTDEGSYMLSRRGNMESSHNYIIKGLQPATYYWSIQTVDNNYSVSDFYDGQFTLLVSAAFDEIDIGLPDFVFGDMAWGDYDNDRDLDLVVNSNLVGPVTKLFNYDSGNDTFNDSGINLTGSHLGGVDWGDYDNDGDLDLLTGNTLYRNDFGSLNMIQQFSFSNSDLLFVDYDNDADLDIFWAQNGQIWKNENSSFTIDTIASQDIVNVNEGDAAWGDYDNDGDKDLIVVGGNYLGYLYRNDNGRFIDWGYDFFGTLDGTLFETNGYQNADIDWADYDNDGDLDFIIIGEGRKQASGVVRITAIYKNNGPDFNNEGQWLFEQTDSEPLRYEGGRKYEGVNYGSVHWADFDNDGWRDFIISGSQGTSINASDYITMIYKNVKTDAFVEDTASNGTLRGMGNSAVAISDIDDDGDLDFLEFGYSGVAPGLEETTRLYENLLNETAVNLPPAVPMGLSYNLLGDTVILSWESAEDDKTGALTYNVRIGTNPGSQNVVSANAYPDGKLKMVYQGNAQSATTFKLTGLAQNQEYFWSVQAIDAAFKSSTFAEESSFNTFPPSVTIQYPNGGEVFRVDSTIFVDWESSYVSDFRLEYSIDNGSSWAEITVINETFGLSSEEWTIPDTPSQQCLVRVTDINNPDINDISNETFTISSGGAKYINIIAPNGGEQWEASSFSTIFWDQAGVADIKVEVSYDNKASFELLTESTPASEGWYSWQLPNFISFDCFIRLSDVNDSAVMDVSDFSFFITDTTGPVFDISEGEIDITSPVDVGYRDTVSVKVADNTEIAEVWLRYKTAGTFDGFNERVMIKEGDEYSWILEAAPETGFQLYAEAMDIHENRAVTDTVGISININDSFENQDEVVGGNSVENYVLFSVPADLNDKSAATFLISNNFDDTPDREDYRFYSYQNGSANNFIEYNNSGFGQINPGRGFFIISNDDFNMVAGNGNTVNPGSTFIIEGLQQGWNLIGSPFIYPIPFGNLSAVNPGSGDKVNFNLWEFINGSWESVQTGELQPWRGYALDLESSANFRIPPYRESLTKVIPKFTTVNNTNDEWMIQIKASNGRNKSDFNFAGQLLNASDALDRYDLNSPPRIEKQVQLSFKNEENLNKVTDIRESNSKGHIWDFVCYLDPKEEKLNLNFSGLDNFSENRDYFLIDNNRAVAYNIKLQNNVEFATKGLSQKDFKLVVGTKAYLESLSLGTELYPTRFTMKQNFPNPFNPATQISFTIRDAGKVKLAVYDLLGQQVAVLVDAFLEPGNYNSVWDATNQSSGIYFIKLASAKKVIIKRAVFIK